MRFVHGDANYRMRTAICTSNDARESRSRHGKSYVSDYFWNKQTLKTFSLSILCSSPCCPCRCATSVIFTGKRVRFRLTLYDNIRLENSVHGMVALLWRAYQEFCMQICQCRLISLNRRWYFLFVFITAVSLVR